MKYIHGNIADYSDPVYRNIDRNTDLENHTKMLSTNTYYKYPIDYIKSHISLSSIDKYPDYKSRINNLSIFHNINSDHILLLNGISSLFRLLAYLYKDSNHTIVHPQYMGMTFLIEKLKLTSSYIILEEPFELNIKNTYGDILYLCNPSNPTSRCESISNIKNIIESNNYKLIVIDQSYLFSLLKWKEYDCISLIKELPNKNILLAYSISKEMGALGMRSAYCIGTKKIIDQLFSIQEEFPVSSLDISLIDIHISEDYRKIYNLSITEMVSDRNYMISLLSNLRCMKLVTNSYTPFLLYRINEKYIDSVYKNLYYSSIYVRNCSNIIGLNNSYIRISITDQKISDRIFNSLKDI